LNENKTIFLSKQTINKLNFCRTMRIANPIYDVVFKYLMEDLVIAQALLSVILNIEIISLEVRPQENSHQYKGRLLMSRIDFKAIIKLPNGTHKIVLIELQKSKKGLEKRRFRRYLAQNYGSVEQIINEKGQTIEDSLPIIAMYFLGFRLKNVKIPVLKVVRTYFNAATNKRIKAIDDFVETLSHDLYAIQIPRLNKVARTDMENVLDVFSQVKYKTDDSKVLEYTGDSENPIVERMVKRLNTALMDQELIRQMNFEEEVELEFNLAHGETEKERKQKEAAIKMAEEERKQKEAAIISAEEKTIQNELLQKQIDELKKLLNEK
jgi:hypothetical protein